MAVRERPVLVAPGAFKGTLRAAQVAAAIGRGLERAGLMPPDLCPVADGGAGTLEALLPRLGGEVVGVDVGASFALLEGGGTALLEAPSSSRAAGELIAAAAHGGAEVILVAAAGAAPRDGGAGALDAIEEAGGLGGARVVVLCGPGGPTRLAGALSAGLDALLEPGPAWVLDALDFDARMRAARAVIAGEGKLDERSLQGRLMFEIGTRTRQAGVPLHAIVGSDALDAFGKRMIDLQVVQEAGNLPELEAAGERLGRLLAEGLA